MTSMVTSAACAALALLWAQQLAIAQPASYPSQRINLVVAFAPGGAANSIARLVGPPLAKRLGQPVVIENRGGAAGSIGARTVTTAAPDGHTVLVTTTSLLITEFLSKRPGYSTAQLAAVAIPASTREMFATRPANAAKDLREFLAGARGKSITYATSGAGSGSHLGAAYFFKTLAKVRCGSRSLSRRWPGGGSGRRRPCRSGQQLDAVRDRTCQAGNPERLGDLRSATRGGVA